MLPATSKIMLQLSSVINDHRATVNTAEHAGSRYISDADAIRIITRGLAALDRCAPPASQYLVQAKLVLASSNDEHSKAAQITAIVEALHADYQHDAMQTIAELVHADLFGDLLEMAAELSEKGFIGPAAIVAGAVLEEQVHKLAPKATIALRDESGRPKGFDKLTVELRNAGLITEIERKTVIAWYAQRNAAAHGNFDQLVQGDVERMIDATRDFVARHPA